MKTDTYKMTLSEFAEVEKILVNLDPDEIRDWQYVARSSDFAPVNALEVTATSDGFMRLDIELERWRLEKIKGHLKFLSPAKLELVSREAIAMLKEMTV